MADQGNRLGATIIFFIGFVFPFFWLLAHGIDRGTKSRDEFTRTLNKTSIYLFYCFMLLLSFALFVFALAITADTAALSASGRDPTNKPFWKPEETQSTTTPGQTPNGRMQGETIRVDFNTLDAHKPHKFQI